MYLFIIAEFIIHLAEKHNDLKSFKTVLQENGAEFSESFVSNLLRIIQHMRPSRSSQGTSSQPTTKSDSLADRFPGLAIPNEPQIPLSDGEDGRKSPVKETADDNDVVADLMAQLEADAPSSNTKKVSNVIV